MKNKVNYLQFMKIELNMKVFKDLILYNANLFVVN